MIDLTHVRALQAGHMVREEISGKKLINKIKCVTNSRVQGAAHMVMHASFSMSDNRRRPLQLQRPVLHLLLVNILLILFRSNGKCRTAEGGYDDRDWDAFTFQRTGNIFAKNAPCK